MNNFDTAEGVVIDGEVGREGRVTIQNIGLMESMNSTDIKSLLMRITEREKSCSNGKCMHLWFSQALSMPMMMLLEQS